jgi:hypothetical protein
MLQFKEAYKYESFHCFIMPIGKFVLKFKLILNSSQKATLKLDESLKDYFNSIQKLRFQYFKINYRAKISVKV